MRSWKLILSLIFLSGLAFGKDWPVGEEMLNQILNRSPRWNQLSQEKQTATRSQLIYALHLAGSLEANKVFFSHINEFWDDSDPLKKKLDLLKEAETLALQSAKKTVEKWTEAKSSNGKLMTAGSIITRLTGGNLATEQFHEWDRFINDLGEINYKSWPLGGNPLLPENQRAQIDLVKFISENYPDSPAQRKERATKLKAESSYYDYGGSGDFEISSPRTGGSHSSDVPMGACGTPSSFAPTLRPEFNGR